MRSIRCRLLVVRGISHPKVLLTFGVPILSAQLRNHLRTCQRYQDRPVAICGPLLCLRRGIPFQPPLSCLTQQRPVLAPIAFGYTSNFCLQHQSTKLFQSSSSTLCPTLQTSNISGQCSSRGRLRESTLYSIPARGTPCSTPFHATNSCTTGSSSQLSKRL